MILNCKKIFSRHFYLENNSCIFYFVTYNIIHSCPKGYFWSRKVRVKFWQHQPNTALKPINSLRSRVRNIDYTINNRYLPNKYAIIICGGRFWNSLRVATMYVYITCTFTGPLEFVYGKRQKGVRQYNSPRIA